MFHWLHKADHQPYYGALKPLLEEHAEHLAKRIDNHPQRRWWQPANYRASEQKIDPIAKTRSPGICT